jgi:ATPase subunit of ABC transporter with duplicated ATPase domains
MGAQWKAKGKAQAADARGKLFGRLAKDIMMAAKSGPDPAANSRLRLVVEQARKVSMPKDTLERAIKKGAGLLGDPVNFERVIYEGFDFSISRKERWCVMGVNGAGKSTLLKLIAGSTKPDTGSVTIGGSVKVGYFAQHAMELLDGEQTIFESLEYSFPQAGQGSLRALAGCFGFSGDDVEKKCRVLSGGEKARLVMAKMLYDPPNFLILDEPTAGVDVELRRGMWDYLRKRRIVMAMNLIFI